MVIQRMIALLEEEVLENKLFLPNKWLNLWRFKTNSKVQKEITQTIEKYKKNHIRHNRK